MDATRPRRTRDRARQRWYARYRQQRFARFLGFSPSESAASHAVSPRAEGDRWISPPRDFGPFSRTLSRNALAADVLK